MIRAGSAASHAPADRSASSYGGQASRPSPARAFARALLIHPKWRRDRATCGRLATINDAVASFYCRSLIGAPLAGLRSVRCADGRDNSISSFFSAFRDQNASDMATKEIIKPAKSPGAVGPYNHAVRAGDMLFCAGQIPIDPKSGELVQGGIEVQTERVLENIRAILEDQKLGFVQVVKSTVFLTDLTDFAAMNQVYSKYFVADYPARSTIQVAALPKGARFEIEIIAHY